MKLFQTTKKYFERCGFTPRGDIINACHVKGFITITIGITCNLMFIYRVAETVKELTESLYVTAAIISLFLCYVTTISKTIEFFAFFNQFNENVTKRKLNLQILEY